MHPCDPKVSLGRPAGRARVNDQLIFISGGTLRSVLAKVCCFSGFFPFFGGGLLFGVCGDCCAWLAAWLGFLFMSTCLLFTASFYLWWSSPDNSFDCIKIRKYSYKNGWGSFH